jgi:hypothetical protein
MLRSVKLEPLGLRRRDGRCPIFKRSPFVPVSRGTDGRRMVGPPQPSNPKTLDFGFAATPNLIAEFPELRLLGFSSRKSNSGNLVEKPTGRSEIALRCLHDSLTAMFSDGKICANCLSPASAEPWSWTEIYMKALEKCALEALECWPISSNRASCRTTRTLCAEGIQ